MNALSLIIQFFIALGTIAVAILAIWGDWVRLKFAAPKLKIEIQDTKKEPEMVRYNDGKKGYYFHLKLTNKKIGRIAKNCKILLVAVAKQLPDGEFETIPFNSCYPFQWTPAGNNPFYKIDFAWKEQLFDFGILGQDDVEFKPAIQWFHNDFEGYVKKGEIKRFYLQVLADNFIHGKPQVFEVAWNGQWTDNREEMKRNLIVKEITNLK